VQALTPTVYPCYAAADAELARRIAGFLERGVAVRVFLEDGEMRPGEDLVSKARDGQTADIVLVLFSRHSLPPRWPRAQWEAALVNEPREEGVRIAFIRCDDCAPPRVLTPLFDLGAAASKGLRQIKRWVRNGDVDLYPPGHSPAIEVLGLGIADRPGVEMVDNPADALEFARAFRADFDEAFIVECTGRSVAAIAGDIGAQLGLRLEGPLDSNLERLHAFSSARRFLFVLHGECPELVFGGRASTLICESTGEAVWAGSDPIQQAQGALAQCSLDWPEICRHARLGRSLLLDAGRFAECHELMRQWHDAAQARGDLAVLDESARELVWILESWGLHEEAALLDRHRGEHYAEQMMLPLY
jgi:TIR domain-containing protein